MNKPVYILLDLDGTLIDIDQDEFLKAYLKEVGIRFADVCPPEDFVAEIWRATETMMENQDPDLTNEQVFRQSFFPRIGRQPEELMPRFDQFYQIHFPALQRFARPNPGARPVIETCLERGLPVVIATNPVFPRQAIMERLRWAGVDDLPYNLVTTYEIMHFCKPHPGYFTEIASRLGADPSRCLMVGDDLDLDLVGAAKVGMMTYHVGERADGDGLEPDGRGDLSSLMSWIDR